MKYLERDCQKFHKNIGENMKPQRTQREIMFKNSVNSLVFADQEAFHLN